MSRVAGIALALAALASVARADGNQELKDKVHVLTELDALPQVASLELKQVQLAAQDPNIDPWIAIRATRTLADYCPNGPTDCAVASTVHDTLHAMIASLSLQAPSTPTPSGRPGGAVVGAMTGQRQLRLRAAVEAMGASRLVTEADIDMLLALLVSPSRDVRAAVVRTLGTSCNRVVRDKLHSLVERNPQVQGEIYAAVLALTQCAPK